MFATEQYSWSDVNIVMLGKVVTGARGVRYKASQEKEPIYGRGSKPVAMGRGNKTYEGELKLLQSELEALQEAAGSGNELTDIAAFDIVISYVPRSGGTQIVTDIIKYAEFTENEKQLNQGDKFMEITLPIVALDIKKNV